jgi:hypothetical protein
MTLCLKPWEPGQCSRHSDYDTGWAIQRSNPGRGETVFSPSKRPDRLWGFNAFSVQLVLEFFPGDEAAGAPD